MVAKQTLTLALLSVAISAQDDKADKTATFQFSGQTLGGRTLDASDFAANVLIVDLWGTWCTPCREAVPHLVGLYQKYKHHGLEIVGFCYNESGEAEDVDTVREFAANQKITYPLLPGDPAVQEQVPDFSGYPTLLLFGKNLELARTQTGFNAETGEQLEQWVRQALGLDDKAKEPEAPAKDPVPVGKIFEPGNGDVGFELQLNDVTGADFQFSSLRGAPVLLALTTSWDQEAAKTAELLERARTTHPSLHVVAWHLERSGNPAEKIAAVRAFLLAQEVGYRAVTSPLKLSRQKIHRFGSLPTLLLFDQEGKLVQRENGISEEIGERLLQAAAQLAAPQTPPKDK